MVTPLLLFLLSGLSLIWSLWSGDGDSVLLALPCTLASLILLLRPWWRGTTQSQPEARTWVIIDGSNVMHWKDGSVSIAPVREVVDLLKAHGFAPGVVFDANAGYKIADRYLHHDAMARQLGLPEEQVMVVPKGTQADPVVLAAARDLAARIVSNDRFRDRAEAFPEVTKPGHLIRGGYRDGELWLDLDSAGKG